MHELSLAQSVVEICGEKAGGRRVTAVVLEIGAFSGVVPEALEFCFDACTRDTPLDGARLVIERKSALARCRDCGAEFSPLAYFDPCIDCGGYRLEMVSGEEMRIKELEVD